MACQVPQARVAKCVDISDALKELLCQVNHTHQSPLLRFNRIENDGAAAIGEALKAS